MISELDGAGRAAAYSGLSRKAKADFLERFWSERNPLVLKYYYGYHLGRRRFTVSDAFFEKGKAVPEMFKLGVEGPDATLIDEGIGLMEFILMKDPRDAVAHCALGYVLLEKGDYAEADREFLEA
ncbi:MAG: hypothetical protein IH991_10825, partial [Planctomycetes bacterium]|nr:hypothetical protein [Planctomycetota bacterium]